MAGEPSAAWPCDLQDGRHPGALDVGDALPNRIAEDVRVGVERLVVRDRTAASPITP